MNKKVLLLFLGLLWMNNIVGQTMVASVDNNLIESGEHVTISYTINGQNAAEFSPPNFNGFKVISGPNQSNTYQNINGRQSRSHIVSYTLQPQRLGKINIGPATVQINKKAIKSNSVSVTVKKGIVRDSYVRLEVSDSTLYVGQQVVLEYVMYTQASVLKYDNLSKLDFEGFFHRSYRVNERGQNIEVKGKPYLRQVLAREILYPQRNGTFNFPPQKVRLGLEDKNNKSRGGFFSVRKTIPKEVITNGVNINVEGLPTPPPNFSGAVGNFEIFSSIDKTTLKQNESLSIFVTIYGNGDIKNVMPPPLNLEDGFDVFDAKVKEELSEINGRFEQSKKVFEYVVIPKKVGRPILQPQFTYFDTDSVRYLTKKAKAFRLNILASNSTEIVNIKDDSDTFRPIQLKYKEANLNFWVQNPLAILGTLLPFLLIGVLWFLKKRNLEKEPARTKQKKQDNASKMAKSILKNADDSLEANDVKGFYAEVAKSLKKYIEDKFEIKALTMSKSNIVDSLVKNNINEDTAQSVSNILSDCEMGQFGMATKEAPKDFYQKALTLLDELDKA